MKFITSRKCKRGFSSARIIFLLVIIQLIAINFLFVQGAIANTWIKYPDNPVLSSGPLTSWDNLKTDPSVLKDGSIYKMWFGTNQDGTLTKIAYAESPDGINWNIYPDPVLEPVAGTWEATDVETPTVIKDDDAPLNERYKMWYSAWDVNIEEYRIGYATSPDGINWEKYADNPVLALGDKNIWAWDGWGTADPMVIKEGGVYKMWYSGVGVVLEENDWHFWVGYAESNDGINWSKHPDNPGLDIGTAGSFESKAVGQPAVLFNGDYYELWYTGWDKLEGDWSSVIGYATSPDGAHWTKSPNNPLIPKGDPGSWEEDSTNAGTVLIEGSEYKMWYTGVDLIWSGGVPVNIEVGIGYVTNSIYQSLTASVTGTGSGTITSSIPGINCTTSCTESYPGNTVITLTATPASGSSFEGWGGDTDCSDGTVIMDASKTCTALFNLIPEIPEYHSLTTSITGTGSGTITSSSPGFSCTTSCTESYPGNTVITLTATPASGSSFEGWGGDTDCSDGTVIMDASKTCTALFNLIPEIPENPFPDVSASHWAKDYIDAIFNDGITTGFPDGTYRPEDTVNRAQMAAFIIRALYGESFSYNATPYLPDVLSGHWAFKYVQRLSEDSITTGFPDGTYGPEDTVNRAQMAAFIARSLYGESFSYSATPYLPDVLSGHWAFKYVQRLYEDGITTGFPDGTYRPEDTVNRAQMAAFIARTFLGVQ